MAEQASPAPGFGVARPKPSLGSFELGTPQSDGRLKASGVLAVNATGRLDSPYAGFRAFAYCVQFGNDAAARSRAAARMASVRLLSDELIVPVFEAGVTASGAYVIEDAPNGVRLTEWVRPEAKQTPWTVTGVVADIAAALQFAHDDGLAHGCVVPSLAWVDGDGHARLGGFGLVEDTLAEDQRQLAALAVELLSGKPWPADAAAGMELPAILGRIRTQAPELTERVALALAKAMHADPGRRYPSVAEFAAAFRAEVVGAGADIAAGAWEAISRDDEAMASLLIAKAGEYDLNSQELGLLRLRMDDRAMRAPGDATQMLVEARLQEQAYPPEPARNVPLPPDPATLSDADREQAIRALLTPPIYQPVATPKRNAWVIMAIVMCALVLVLAILAALAFASA